MNTVTPQSEFSAVVREPVRIAGPSDAQEVWRLLLQSFNENGMLSLAPDKVGWFMARCLDPSLIHPEDTGTRGVIGVIGPVGALKALAFLTIGEMWYSYDKNIEEFVVYVDPEHRRGTHHIDALHDWMKEQTEITGLPLISGIMSNKRTEEKCRLYKRRFQKIGEFYLHAPTGWQSPNPLFQERQG